MSQQSAALHIRAPAGNNRLGCGNPADCLIEDLWHTYAPSRQCCTSLNLELPLQMAFSTCHACLPAHGASTGTLLAASNPGAFLLSKHQEHMGRCMLNTHPVYLRPWTPQTCPRSRRIRSRAPAGNNRLGSTKPIECPSPHTKPAAVSLQRYCTSINPEQPARKGFVQSQRLPGGRGAFTGNPAAASSPRRILPAKPQEHLCTCLSTTCARNMSQKRLAIHSRAPAGKNRLGF